MLDRLVLFLLHRRRQGPAPAALAPTMQTNNPTAVVEADAEAVTKSPSIDSASDVRSATITLASRQQLELRDGLGSADNKIPSDSDVGSVTKARVSRCGDFGYVFKACMVSVSFILVLSSPLLPRHLYSEPLSLLWTIAAVISAYIISLIFIFSPTMCLSALFFHMPFPVLLAIAADRFVGHRAGFLVMHMATGWLAGLLGYAYAKHLWHIGRETTAKHMHIIEEDEWSLSLKRGRGHAAFGFGFISLLFAIPGAALSWIIPVDELPIFVFFVSTMEGIVTFSWVAFVARFVLYDALLSLDQLGYIIVFYICPYAAISFVLLGVLIPFGFTGSAIGATCLWCLMLSIAGLLGYELSVHAQCKQMMHTRYILNCIKKQQHWVLDKEAFNSDRSSHATVEDVCQNPPPLHSIRSLGRYLYWTTSIADVLFQFYPSWVANMTEPSKPRHIWTPDRSTNHSVKVQSVNLAPPAM